MTDQAERLEPIELFPEETEPATPVRGTAPGHRRPRLRSRAVTLDLVLLVALVAVVAFLWGRAAGMSFWLDEGISVGVASHPLRDIPELLRQESAPPLYYLLLNVWIAMFGESNSAVHVLSLLFALATVPAALWAGWSLFDRRTGWMCALVVAINPFVAYYATEARMYTMATFLAVVTIACFLHVFVFGRRRYLPWFALSQAMLLYTHNWGLLLAVGAGVALLPLLAMATARRRLVIDAVLGFGGVALLYAPWVPSIIYQIGQELQPWGRKGDLVWVRDDVAKTLGGEEAVVVLGLAAGLGLASILSGRGWRTRDAMAVVASAVIPFVVLAAGWSVSVWAYRYLAVIVAPLVLLVGLGLGRSGRVGLAALGVAAFLTAPLALKGPPYQKSNVEALAAELSPQLRPGDLVILPDLQLVPLVAHYLPDGLRYANASGLVPDEDIIAWRGSMERLRNDDPAVTLPPLIDAVAPGGRVLAMCLTEGGTTDRSGLASSNAGDSVGTNASTSVGAAPKTKVTPAPADVQFQPLIQLRCEQTEALLADNRALRLQEVLTAPPDVRDTSVRARLLVKEPQR